MKRSEWLPFIMLPALHRGETLAAPTLLDAGAEAVAYLDPDIKEFAHSMPSRTQPKI